MLKPENVEISTGYIFKKITLEDAAEQIAALISAPQVKALLKVRDGKLFSYWKGNTRVVDTLSTRMADTLADHRLMTSVRPQGSFSHYAALTPLAKKVLEIKGL